MDRIRKALDLARLERAKPTADAGGDEEPRGRGDGVEAPDRAVVLDRGAQGGGEAVGVEVEDLQRVVEEAVDDELLAGARDTEGAMADVDDVGPGPVAVEPAGEERPSPLVHRVEHAPAPSPAERRPWPSVMSG